MGKTIRVEKNIDVEVEVDLKDFPNDSILAEVTARNLMPRERDIEDFDDDILASEYDERRLMAGDTPANMIRMAIEDRDWKMVEAAAEKLGIKWSWVLVKRAEESAKQVRRKMADIATSKPRREAPRKLFDTAPE